MVPILFDCFSSGLGLGRGGAKFKVFDGVNVFRTAEKGPRLRDIHVEGELKIDFIILLVDLEKEVGRRSCFLLFLLHFLYHFLSNPYF